MLGYLENRLVSLFYEALKLVYCSLGSKIYMMETEMKIFIV